MLVKSVIRKEINEKRKNLSPTEIVDKSIAIIDNLMGLKEYEEADDIYTYVNYQNEVITTDLIEQTIAKGKRIYVPKVIGNEMNFFRIVTIDDLVEGYKGILEPKEGLDKPGLFNNNYNKIMIMPGLAFDINMHRIGYGGGFYDKYLDWNPMFTKIAICYDFQVLDEIPYEAFDQQPDIIITEERIIKKGDN